MYERRNTVLTGTSQANFGSLFKVVVYQRGAHASANGPGLSIPVLSGHGFQLGDKAVLDPGGLNIITSPVVGFGENVLTFAESYVFGAGMRIANVGADTAGAGQLNYQASRMTIHPVADPSNRISNATVNCDTQGNYAYDYLGSGGAWEIILGVDNTIAGVVDGFSSVGGTTFNVWDYGCGGGRSTDGPAIQAALLGVPVGGELFLPGVYDYLLKDSIDVKRGDITITFGPGARMVVDSDSGSSIKCIHLNPDGASGTGRMSNFRINNFSGFDPDPADHSGTDETHGIVANRCDNVVIHSSKCENFGDEGINLIKCGGFAIFNTFLDANGALSGGGSGIELTNSFNGIVRDVEVKSQSNGSAIEIVANNDTDQQGNIEIHGVLIRALNNTVPGEKYGKGIVVTVTNDAHFQGLIIDSVIVTEPMKHGLVLQTPGLPAGPTVGLHDFSISNVTVIGGGTDAVDTAPRGAIDLDGGIGIGSIRGCIIDGWGVHAVSHYGIRIAGGNITISGNSIKNAVASGKAIYTDGGGAGEENVIVGNAASDGNNIGTGDLVGDTTPEP